MNTHCERGRITGIDTAGVITLQVAGDLVSAQIYSGGGGWVGDEMEGVMRRGSQTWRLVGSGSISTVYVLRRTRA